MPVKPFELQFPVDDLEELAASYSYSRDPTAAEEAGQAAAAAGYLTRAGLHAIVDWKSRRSRSLLCDDEDRIREVSAAAIADPEESGRMGSFVSLEGIGVPIASSILLFTFGESYPILDVRALRSLNHARRGRYPIPFWIRYLEYCRSLAAERGLTPRKVDQALWEYDKRRSALC